MGALLGWVGSGTTVEKFNSSAALVLVVVLGITRPLPRSGP